MQKNYLPSKQFIARLTILIGGLVIVGVIYQVSLYIKNRPRASKLPAKLLVAQMVQKDSNGNGIADWEESLWGLDPSKDPEGNKAFILARRTSLSQGNEAQAEGGAQAISETDTISRQFFASIMSLSQSGSLTDQSMQAITDTIGKKMVAEVLGDTYSEADLSSVKENEATIDAYRQSLAKVMLSYKDSSIGTELSLISVALKNNDSGALRIAGETAVQYHAFAKDIMKLQVPRSFVAAHLALANDYEKTGTSIENLAKIFTEPFSGMKGLIQYNKYSNAIVTDYQKLSDINY